MSASVVEAFCCSNPLINAALHVACAPFVLELTRLGLKMERMIARDGDLKGACAWLVGIGAAGARVQGAEAGPAVGAAAIRRQPRRLGRRACGIDVVAAARHARAGA